MTDHIELPRVAISVMVASKRTPRPKVATTDETGSTSIVEKE